MKRYFFCVLALLIVLCSFSGCSRYQYKPLTDYSNLDLSSPEPLLGSGRVTVTHPAYNTHQFFIPVVIGDLDESIRVPLLEGIDSAAKDYNITVEYFIAENKTDVQTQSDALCEIMARNPQAVCLMTSDLSNLTHYINKLRASKVPIISLDNSMTTPLASAYCKPDGAAAGEEAAHRLCEAVRTKAKIAVAASNWSDAVSSEIIESFKSTIAQNYPKVEVINVPNNPEVSSYEQCFSFLSSNPSLDAVFAVDTKIFNSLINAKRSYVRGLDDDENYELLISGVGTNPNIKSALPTEEVYGTYLIDYTEWGYRAMSTAFSACIGGEFDPVIQSKYVWVNAENLNLPAIQNLLNR